MSAEALSLEFARILNLPMESLRLDLHLLAYQEIEHQSAVLERVDQSITALSEQWAKKRSDSPQMEIFWDECWKNSSATDDAPPFMVKPPGSYARLDGRYVQPENGLFEAAVQDIVRRALFGYFKECGAVYEFGCGNGRHLLALAQHNSRLRLFGLDRSMQAVARVNALKQLGGDISGRRFDLRKPSWELKLLPDSGIFTVGALEQIGYQFGPFLRFMLANKPKICVHLEPIVELYDTAKEFDRVAARYHHVRGYLAGFLPALQELEQRKLIRIHEVWRAKVGAVYHEAMTRIVWSPL